MSNTCLYGDNASTLIQGSTNSPEFRMLEK